MKRCLALLGATGSIGTSALEVVRHHADRLRVVTMAVHGSRLAELEAQIAEFRPEVVAVRDPEAAAALVDRVGSETRIVSGEQGLIEAATHREVDLVVAAIVGAAGLPPVYAALDAAKNVALANKECLVVAGGLLTQLANRRRVSILPIDSEHVALHQSLRCGRAAEVERLMLTASGGPFRQRDTSTWDEIAPAEALNHPTWSMGAKISIDSATLMNKGLELIEASHLFDIPPDRIQVVVHPQSLVHSLVEFCDGSWIAQLSVNDMIFPIQYALAYPDRWRNEFPRLEPKQLGRLDFEPLDHERFPSVNLAREALAMGESGPAVMNAANEIAVHAFLDDRLPFRKIISTIAKVLHSHDPAPLESLEDALGWDQWGRHQAERLLSDMLTAEESG